MEEQNCWMPEFKQITQIIKYYAFILYNMNCMFSAW